MEIKLRGHHLLCLLGYRGKGYSEPFCENMTHIYERLRTHPETLVEIIDGPDDICKAFPKDQHAHCDKESVFRKDVLILSKVGVDIDERLSWAEICRRVAARVQPDDIDHLCATCQWRPLGLCKEGIRLIENGRPLPSLLPPLG